MESHEDLKKIISGIFKGSGKLAKGYKEYDIEQVWRATFGGMISNYTTRVRFNKGVLEVYINSAPLKQELDMTKPAVIAKLNKNLKYDKVVKLIVR